MKIFLANIPPWYPNQPYLSVPLLTGILRDANYDVIQQDLNLSFYLFLLEKKNLQAQVDLIKSTNKNLDEHENDLLSLSDYLISNIEESIKVFRSEEFYDLTKSKEATETIELCLKLYSIQYNQTKVCLGDTVFEFNQYNLEEIFSYVENEKNNIFSFFFKTSILPQIQNKNVDVFALSVTTTQQLIPALTFASIIKANLPNIKVVFGGDIITRLKDKLIDTKKIWSIIDYCIYSFGEDAFTNLIASVETKSNFEKVSNLIWNKNGVITKNQEETNFRLNNMPNPDFDGLPLDEYLSPKLMLPVEFSKGCYWGKCTFCEIVGMPYKVKNANVMANEMLSLSKKYDTDMFTIVDSASPPAKLRQLATTLANEKKPIYWRTMIKAEKYFDKESVKILFDGGCRLVMIGVESGNQRVLNLMEKGVSVNDVQNTIRNLSNAGIWVHNFYMFRFPTETLEEANETVKFIKENLPYLKSVSASRFILPKESTIYKNLKKYSITEIQNNTKNDLVIHHTQFKGDLLTEDEFELIDNKYSKLVNDNTLINEFDDIHLNYYFLHSTKNKKLW